MPQELLTLGPFTLDERIARGGMGEVWRAHHVELGLAVALKILDSRRPPTRRALKALRQEVRAIASLDHPHIVKIHDYGRLPAHTLPRTFGAHNAEAPYFVMEFAAGGSLAQLPHSLAWPQIRELLLTVLDALAHAHSRGVIHRDLKPGNILLRQGISALDDLILSDFGLAYAMQEELSEATQDPSQIRLLGTPAYMAPEQIRHELREQGPWTDLYALGCLAWQLIHGQAPFGIDPTDEVLREQLQAPLPPWNPRVNVPDGLRAWLRSMLAKNPYDRFAFAAEASRALTQLDSLTGEALGLSHYERSDPFEERPLLRGVGPGLYELRPVPLVGRERERRLLWESFEHTVSTSSPHLVLLHGMAGLGKSRLATWLVQRVHEQGAALSLSALHEPNPQAIDGLSRMLANALRISGAPREEARRMVRRYLHRSRLLDDTPETLEQDARVLLELATEPSQKDLSLDTECVEQPDTTLPSHQERQATWLRFLRRLCQRKPVVVFIDDAQWASELLSLTLATLEHAWPHPLPVLFVLTVRDESLQAGSAQAQQIDALIGLLGPEHARSLPLEPLEPLVHERLIRQLLPLSPGLVSQVALRTHGNPLFTIQLVGDWVQRGVLTTGRRGWLLSQGESTQLPENIHQLWRQRIRQVVTLFPEEAASRAELALQMAAALGRDVVGEEWRAACECDGIAIPEGLVERMITHRLAVSVELGWSFYHEMLRESLLLMAEQAGHRQALHHCCARMLVQRYDVHQPQVAERLAYHYIEAGELERALPLLLVSLDHLRVVGEFYQARQVQRRWAHIVEQLRLPHGDLRQLRGEFAAAQLHIAQGHLNQAEEVIARARHHAELAEELSLRVEAQLLQARLSRKRGELWRAQELLEQTMRLLEQQSSGPLDALSEEEPALVTQFARTLLALGEVEAGRGQLTTARHRLLRAILLFRRLGPHPEELGRGLMMLSEVLARQGDVSHAEELLREAVTQFTQQHNRAALASCNNLQGDMAREQQHLEQARVHYERARALFHALGSDDVVFPTFNLVLLDLMQQDYALAARRLPPIKDAFCEQGRQAYVGLVELARALCLTGQPEAENKCLEILSRGLVLLENSGSSEPDALWLSGELAHRAHQLEWARVEQLALRFLLTQYQHLGQFERAEAVEGHLKSLEI